MQSIAPAYSLNCRGKLLSLEKPLVMGILNLTPDSFSDGGKYNEESKALRQVEKMLIEGVSIIDIGGYSSRPNAQHISVEEELGRIRGITERILTRFPMAIVSIDTFRAEVAKEMLELGVHIINDISAGDGIDPDPDHPAMMEIMSAYPDAPYILMHMKGRPQNMQDGPEYDDVVEEVWDFFVQKINQAKDAGIRDIILDPGFGFGKEILHNYQMLSGMDQFAELGLPVLVGVSRKSMLYKLFHTTPDDVKELSSILHFKALEQGAQILRVHDVREAVRTVELFQYFLKNGII